MSRLRGWAATAVLVALVAGADLPAHLITTWS